MVELDNKSIEDMNTLRRMVLDRLAGNEENFHAKDIDRLKNDDKWVIDFLDNNDFNIKNSFKQCIDTLEWRKSYGVNEITEETLRQDYLHNNNIMLHGRDLEGKLMLTFLCKLHVRGSKDVEDLKRIMVYYIERGFRESKNEKLTLIFDMAGTGMKNIDMTYTQSIINTFKNYYPNSLNWILVFEMPWIMTATFQIIKKLLPKNAVEVLKFVDKKSIREYIGEDNMLVSWGGTDEYELSFVPEKTQTSTTA